ncbi:hypothetical protein C2E23DRAFT_932329 [Lenzites betulinus]|nr:hypothetical protein C2E23DRAFT_932329 [Lenzites betulinus]
MARTSQKPKLTKEERMRGRQRTAQMWEDINAERESYNTSINDLAEKHKKSRQWIAMQLFRGGKLLASRRKKSLFNAVVHDLSKKRSEAGTSPVGRSALSELAKEAADLDWKNLPEHEQKRLLQQLETDSTPPAGRIAASESGNHVEGILRRIQPELDGLAARTGCQYLLIVTKREVTDSWLTRVSHTPKVAEACTEIYKCTPETMALRMEACITSGKAGLLRAMGGKRSTQLKGEIRAKVNEGLEELLTKHGVAAAALPRMEWVRYSALVAEHGVELIGWPEQLPKTICNPSDIKTTAQLDVLHAALFSTPPQCYWVRLSSEEWELRKEKHRADVLESSTIRKQTRADGKTATKKRKKPSSAEIVEDSEEETEPSGPPPEGPSIDSNAAQSPGTSREEEQVAGDEETSGGAALQGQAMPAAGTV